MYSTALYNYLYMMNSLMAVGRVRLLMSPLSSPALPTEVLMDRLHQLAREAGPGARQVMYFIVTSQWPHTLDTMGYTVLPLRPVWATPRY